MIASTWLSCEIILHERRKCTIELDKIAIVFFFCFKYYAWRRVNAVAVNRR